jgi:superfamily II DNA helicase RecQ
VTSVASADPTASEWLPYLLVMKVGQTTVISHQAALWLYLAAQEGSVRPRRGAPSIIRYYDQEANGTRPWQWKGRTFEAVVSKLQPGAKSQGGIPAWCLIPITAGGRTVEVRVTSLEQTLVDIMGNRARRRQGSETATGTTSPPPNGPIELDANFLECWRELGTSNLQFDIRALRAYLQAIGSRSTTSKVAYYLDGNQERHGMRASHVWALSPRLKHPRPWRERVTGELVFPWLLRVPPELKHLPTPKEDVSEAPRLAEGRTVEKLDLEASLRELYPNKQINARFRPGQKTLILEILKGRDALGVMPTGAGKSLCYQLPAKLLNGLTLVISPLLALINDQVEKANGLGITAMAFGRTSDATREQVLLAIHEQTLKLLFVSPESLTTLIKVFDDLKSSVVQLVVDEAHTILTWGQDFRFALNGLHRLRGIWPNAPLLALTATANQSERHQLMAELGLRADMEAYVGSTYRPGLYLQVKKVSNGFISKLKTLMAFIKMQEKHRGAKLCGIVYCPSKSETERVAIALARVFGESEENLEEQEDLDREFRTKEEMAGRPSKRDPEDKTFCLPFPSRVQCYHAGISQFGKDQAEFVFRKGKARIMVATVAFGMGIDKSDVRFVVHFGPPTTVGSYVQEVGRAGRDGQEAECLLLHSKQDWIVWKKRFESESSGKAKKSKNSRQVPLHDREKNRRDRLDRHLLQLNEIKGLLLHSTCLHQAIAKHYDETIPICDKHCGKCQFPGPHRKDWRTNHPKHMAPIINVPVNMEEEEESVPVPAYEVLGEPESASTQEVDLSESEPLWPYMETMDGLDIDLPSLDSIRDIDNL